MNREKKLNLIMELLIENHKYIDQYERIPRTYGSMEKLYMAECHTLEIILNNPNITITEISKLTGKTKASVSKMTNRLVEKGYLLKEVYEENKNFIKLTLTEKGKKICILHNKFDKESYKNIFDNLKKIDIQELETFIKIQKILNEQFKKNTEI
ncbi:MarR family winged helix-turn-helix transcriptional regulator [Cetobacterium sp.]|uniref:MarR family winged helix-turn-helix transcriptional regulator n=1 Tax=Cetobacterium sp. TaxID=2071632 RepID=UPI003EE641E4